MRSITIGVRGAAAAKAAADAIGEEVSYPRDVDRPRTRGDCAEREAGRPRGAGRPCPFVSCAYHLYLDVSKSGGLKLNFPSLEVWELKESCALDVAAAGGATLEEVGAILNVTRERVRQMEEKSFRKLRNGRRSRRLIDAHLIDFFGDGSRAPRQRLPVLNGSPEVRARGFAEPDVDADDVELPEDDSAAAW